MDGNVEFAAAESSWIPTHDEVEAIVREMRPIIEEFVRRESIELRKAEAEQAS